MRRVPLTAISRRQALACLGALVAVPFVTPGLYAADPDEATDGRDGTGCAGHAHSGARRTAATHPDPRPGITGAHVLPDERIPKRHKDAFAAARAIPEVLDGLYCHCECAERRGRRSLLSCFESEMPLSCGICTGEARLAWRLQKKGRSLNEIRAEIDRKFS